MKWKIVAGFCIALLYCSGLGFAQKVRYNYMPGTNFAQYHTYRWIDIRGREQVNQIVDQEIKQAVDRQMTQKGFVRSDSDNADLEIGYQVAVQQQEQWNVYNPGWGWGGMGSVTSSTIDIGSLVVDIYAPAQKQLVWTGTATKTLQSGGNQEKHLKNLDKSIAKLMKDFPPPAK